jgi:hypothetical protein
VRGVPCQFAALFLGGIVEFLFQRRHRWCGLRRDFSAHANRKDRSSATDKAASSDLEHELSFLLDLLSSDYARFRDGLQFIPTRPKLDGVSLDATISAVQYKDSAHCLNRHL